MSACVCCGRAEPLDIPIIGVQRGINEEPVLILWICVCKTTRAIRWEDATYGQRIEAGLVQLSREGHNEMRG